MLQTAKAREFHPRYVCFDSWYSSLENLKAVRGHGWQWLTRLKCNRQVNPGDNGPDEKGNVAVADIDISAHGPFDQGRTVHLKGYGFVQVFRTVAPNGDTEQGKVEHWATSDLKMMEITRQDLSRQVFAIENYHRQLKQCCGVERAQVRSIKAQTCHILLSVRAFVRLETHRLQTGMSGYAAKANIIREAIRLYLQKPTILLEATA